VRFSSAMLLLCLLCAVSSRFHLVVGSSKSELLFPYGTGFNDQNLVNETDDFSSVEVELTTPVVFYEQSYSSIYVSFVLLFILLFLNANLSYLISFYLYNLIIEMMFNFY
jgi:hypothetical protein